MCTAISHNGMFGRNLDLEYDYDKKVVITPRMYPLFFRKTSSLLVHHAYIGMATLDHQYPLYFDAVNEQGLAIAALDFPDNAFYTETDDNFSNIAPFEFSPWILSQCGCIEEVYALMETTRIVDIAYNDHYAQTPLHWIISDKKKSIVIESMKDGIHIYDNSVGVLCNNPPFPYQIYHLTQFMHLSASDQANWDRINLPTFGGGLAAIGLPGDFSSPSRFVKSAFVKYHSHCPFDEINHVTQFFHILDTVAMPRGAIRVRGEKDEITRYSCCCDLDKGIYYFTSYENRRIQAVKLFHSNLCGKEIEFFSLLDQQDIFYKN